MFSYSPLITVVIAFGLLGTTAKAEPAEPYGPVRTSNLYIDSVSHSDSVTNDESFDQSSRSDDKDPGTFIRIRQNVEGLIYTKKKRDVILDFFRGDDDFSMPSALPSDGPSLYPSGVPISVVSPELIKEEQIFEPSKAPSENPSTAPNDSPSENPSTTTSEVPSKSSSFALKDGPSASPTTVPSESPSQNPTSASSEASSENSMASFPPSFLPSSSPTFSNFTDDFVENSSNFTDDFGEDSSNFTDDFVEDSSNFTDDFGEDSLTSTTTQFPSSNSTFVPSLVPTLDDCLITEEERAAQILLLLEAAGTSTKIRDLDNPQGLAADWIINKDFRKECPSEKIVQRWVIAVFYFATNGEFWDKCSAAGSDPCGSEFPFEGARRFLSDFNECEWAGITCNDDDCVTEIEFEQNALVGTIPTELGLLKELAVLGMERGGLSSTIPSEIGLLTKLVFIDLDFNELTGSIPIALYSLTNLETLDLNDNFLEGDIDLIGVFENLQFLQLQSNQFTGTVPEDVGNLTMMTTFNLHENLFTGTMPESVCDLRESLGGFLQSLIADCGNITGFGPDIECECCSSCRG